MNVFSCLRNSSWPNPSCDYQMNGKDIRLGYTNLWGILDGKWTIRYESISDILISMFSGINKYSQGRNVFVIDFGSSRYQKFVISLICISAEFPTYSVLFILACSPIFLYFIFKSLSPLDFQDLIQLSLETPPPLPPCFLCFSACDHVLLYI